MLVLPAPEGPNSAVHRPRRERHVQRESAQAVAQGDLKLIARPFRGAAIIARRHEQKRQQDGEPAQPRRFRFAAGRLQRGVDRQRQGLGLAGNVGDEGDDGAELAQAGGKGGDRSADDAGQRQGQGDVDQPVERARAQRAGGLAEPRDRRLPAPGGWRAPAAER